VLFHIKIVAVILVLYVFLTPDGADKDAGNNGAFFILQLHDELMYEVSDQHVTQVAHLVKHHMENAFALTVTMPVKVKVGTSWAKLKDLTL